MEAASSGRSHGLAGPDVTAIAGRLPPACFRRPAATRRRIAARRLSPPPPVDVKTREARAVQLASQLEIDTDWGSSPPSVAATCGGRWAGVCRCHSVSGLSRGLQTGTQDFLMAPGPRVGPGPPIQHRARAYWAQSAPGQGKLAHGWAIRFAPVLRVGTGPRVYLGAGLPVPPDTAIRSPRRCRAASRQRADSEAAGARRLRLTGLGLRRAPGLADRAPGRPGFAELAPGLRWVSARVTRE